MGREHLAGRDNWQADSALSGSEMERAFDAIMRNYLIDTNYEYQPKPSDLSAIYGYYPTGRPHGIFPDAVIRNRITRRALYIEIKRQGGGGNAHERACKYFTPGLIASTRVIANQPNTVIPFWWVFTDELATKYKYVQEIRHWFAGIDGNVLLWPSLDDYNPVIDHFDRHIAPMLG